MLPAASKLHSHSIHILILKQSPKWVLWWKNIHGDFSWIKENEGERSTRPRGQVRRAKSVSGMPRIGCVTLHDNVEHLRTFVSSSIQRSDATCFRGCWDHMNGIIYRNWSKAIMGDKFLWPISTTINVNCLPLFRFSPPHSAPDPAQLSWQQAASGSCKYECRAENTRADWRERRC